MDQEESCVPPGFRFHPTEEELVGYYLARKVASQKIDLDIIQEVDLYRIEPWDLLAMGSSHHGDEQTAEWYFFSYKDRKYPSGTRTNRATAAGFWKATGRDKPVVSRSRVIGMRKTLVFYRGRAPNGRKTDWIMHEYRLQCNDHAPAQEEGWVVCRAFQKPIPNQRPFFPSYGGYDHLSIRNAVVGALDGDHHRVSGSSAVLPPGPAAGANDACFFFPQPLHYSDHDYLLESKKHLFPQLESPTSDGYVAQRSSSSNNNNNPDHDLIHGQLGLGGQQAAGAIDWNFLDTLLSTTSHQLHEPSSTSLLQ